MNRGIYSLANGMLASQHAMDLVANNLANVNTQGFKQDQLLFNDALQKSLSSPDGTKQVGGLGTGPVEQAQYTDFSQGGISDTSNPNDLALMGPGMFAVQSQNGQVMYTRNGSFIASADGTLTDAKGNAVLDSSLNPVKVRPGAMHVSDRGEISTGSDTNVYTQIGIFNGSFTKTDTGLFASSNAQAQRPDAGGTKIKQGAVEGSNVSPVTTMVQMISLQRAFDMAQKSIQSEDDMTQQLTSVLTS